MPITITHGKGEGPTELASFDRALYDAGIANYNLVELSSIIPTGSEIVVKKFERNNNNHGNRLYVVLSYRVEDEVDEEAWAGLGWVYNDGNQGFFVEEDGTSKEEVEDLIKKTARSMESYRFEGKNKIKSKIVGLECKEKPVCSVVAAVFGEDNWAGFDL